MAWGEAESCGRVVQRGAERCQFVECQSDGIDIAAGIRFARQLFGSGIAQRADRFAQGFAVPTDRPGKSEVGQADGPVLVDQQIAGLDVAMQRPLPVRVGEGLGHLDAHVCHQSPMLSGRRRSVRAWWPRAAGLQLSDPLVEAYALHQRHDVIM